MDAGGREFRFRGDLYFQESTFPLALNIFYTYTHTVRDLRAHAVQVCYSLVFSVPGFWQV